MTHETGLAARIQPELAHGGRFGVAIDEDVNNKIETLENTEENTEDAIDNDNESPHDFNFAFQIERVKTLRMLY